MKTSCNLLGCLSKFRKHPASDPIPGTQDMPSGVGLGLDLKDAFPQRLKGASNFRWLTVSLKRYPDTNLEFLQPLFFAAIKSRTLSEQLRRCG